MAAVSDVAAHRIGSEVAGKYRLESLLGEGGMGTVYRGRHRWTDASVAVKLLARSNATSAIAIERFVREARAAARIEHPNVVRVLDMGEDGDGSLYLVQELLDGPDAQAHLAEQLVLSPRECARIVVPVLRGLQRVHDAGVIHRDIKPANIVLARNADGTIVPKLIDFGVARLVEPGDATSTRSGHALGTPAYMSPEQARGARDIDARTDVWSMGVLIFEMLAGRRPFEGGNAQAAIAAILTEEPTPLGDVCEGLPRDVIDVVMTALRDRDERYSSAAAFADAVEACPGFASEVVATPIEPRTLTGELTRTASHAATVETPPVPVQTPVRRARAMPWIAAAVLVATIAGGMVWMRTRGANSHASDGTPTARITAHPAPAPALAAPVAPETPVTVASNASALPPPPLEPSREPSREPSATRRVNATSTNAASPTNAASRRRPTGFNGAPLLDPLSQN